MTTFQQLAEDFKRNPSSSSSSSSSSSIPKVPQRHRDASRIFHHDWFGRESLRIVQRLLWWLACTSFVLIMISFVIFCVVSLVENIPFVGPLLVYLLRTGSNQFMDWVAPTRTLSFSSPIQPYIASIALFFSSIPSFLAANNTTYPTPNELGPRHIPLNEPISSTYHNAINLSSIGLSMLSCSQLLKYSHHSLLGAGAIVRASNIDEREKLAAEYDRLEYVTRELSNVLRQYDLEVNSLIKSLEMNLNFTVDQFTKVLRKLHLFQTSPAAAAVQWGVTTIPAALCVGLVFTTPLSPAAAAGCIGGAFIAFTQGSCYIHAFSFAANSPPICIPLYLLGIGQPSAAATQELSLQGDRIAAEFIAFNLITEHHIDVLFSLSEAGLSGAKEAEKLYTAINELRFRGENRVKADMASLAVKAAHTPGWQARFFSGKTKGLSEPESYYNASLAAQLRNFSELEHAHKDALSYFRASELLLETVSLSFHDLSEAVVAFRARTSSAREWHRIADEVELLRPLIEELKELGNYHDDRRRRVIRLWKSRWDLCMQTRWKDWADCVFEAGFKGEGG